MLTKVSRVLRSLTVGAIKDGFRWVVGNTSTLKDEEGEYFKVIISSIIKHDEQGIPYWVIYVKKIDDLDAGEFIWKVHRKGDQSVTEEFELDI